MSMAAQTHVSAEATSQESDRQPRPLLGVWQALEGFPVLGDIATVANGIAARPLPSDASRRFMTDQSRAGFAGGSFELPEGFEPLLLRDHVSQATNVALLGQGARTGTLLRERPKVVVNSERLSYGPWVITGAPDHQGLVLSSLFHFHALWPAAALSVDVLAAIVNGPVANAFMSTQRTSRDNRVETLQRIPVPWLNDQSSAAIEDAVRDYRDARLRWLETPDERRPLFTERDDTTTEEAASECLQALRRLDAALLRAYDLPPRLERELLDLFAGHRRPGPVPFDRYYPEGYRPALPWHLFVSGAVARASAQQTLRRLPVLRDPIISEVVAELEQ